MAKSGQINFLPEDYLERRRQQRTNILCLSLFGVVIVGLMGAFLLDERRQAAAAEKRDAVNSRMDAVGRQLLQIEEMQKRKDKMMRKADVTASLLEPRPRHYVVALLTNSLPEGASLVRIDLSTKEVKPKKAAPAGRSGALRASRAARSSASGSKAPTQSATEKPTRLETIRVTGLAADDKVVSRFIAALDGSPLFKRVDLLFSEEHTHDGRSVRRFMLAIELDSQSQVTDEMIQAQRFKSGVFDGGGT